jgi:hypothetical protein
MSFSVPSIELLEQLIRELNIPILKEFDSSSRLWARDNGEKMVWIEMKDLPEAFCGKWCSFYSSVMGGPGDTISFEYIG